MAEHTRNEKNEIDIEKIKCIERHHIEQHCLVDVNMSM